MRILYIADSTRLEGSEVGKQFPSDLMSSKKYKTHETENFLSFREPIIFQIGNQRLFNNDRAF